MGKGLLVLLGFLYAVQINAQTTLSGVVLDADENPAVGAYIIALGDPITGTSANVEGEFTLPLSPGDHQVVFKYLGMLNDTISFHIAEGEQKVVRIVLQSRELGPVQVRVGKFDQKKEELTYSIEIIKPSLIEDKNTRSIESILDQTPGLNIMDGEPQIRGGSGFTFGVGSKVAVLVDDMPILSGDAGRPEWGFVPVENIEQIEITKGASSVLSGSSALSGSIHIRTAYPTATPLTKVNVY